MKRALVTLFAGASVLVAGAAHAACAGSTCVDLKPFADVHAADDCDNTGSDGCCVYYMWNGQQETLACV